MSRPVTRVLVVEDSLTIRKHIVAVLSAAPELEVVGEAADGKAAIELCIQQKPDVVTMDMMMPVMTGLAATEYIMAYCPTPILIVSASTNRGEVFRTYDALAAGAVDVLEKRETVDGDDAWERDLIAAVLRVSRIPVITHLRGKLEASRPPPAEPVPQNGERVARRVVVIGASTGGPGALCTVLKELPPDFPLPVLIVLHIAEPFGRAMADWLDAQVSLRVRYAVDGESLPRAGEACVLMAPPGQHLELVGGRLRLSLDPERHSCRPSVDVLFSSVARELGAEAVACLLTGMGRDGAAGLLDIKNRGGLTLVQDEETSVVFGMPREAIKLGAACQVLPLSGFARAITQATSMRTKGGAR